MSSTPTRRIGKCKACGGAIIWSRKVESNSRVDRQGKPFGVIDTTGERPKPNPIDAEVSPDGNILLSEDGETYTIVPVADRGSYGYYGVLHLSHFVTCPNRDQFRKGAK